MSNNNVEIYRVIKYTYYGCHADSSTEVLLTTFDHKEAKQFQKNLAPHIETEKGPIQEKITLEVQTAEILVEWS